MYSLTMSPYPTRESVRRCTDEIAHRLLDPVAAVDAALRRADVDTACELLLAEAVAGQPPDARRVGAVLPELSDIELFPLLVGVCGGDRVSMLLDVVEQDRMSSERDALALFLAVQLLDGEPPPPRLTALLRTHARRPLDIEASILLALAATDLGDKDVLEVARGWLPMAQVVEAKRLREKLLQKLLTPPLQALPERPPARVISGFTVRRPVAKVGRNDPCPCGSGKKYKKCCAEKDAERIRDPSPLPGLTRAEYLRSAGQQMTSEEIHTLRPQELAEIDFPTLPTLPLIAALRRLTAFHRWDLAERAMEELAVRTDMPGGDPDGYRAELIAAAVKADNLDFAERQIGRLHNRAEAFPSDLLALELRRPSEHTLARIAETAAAGLRDATGSELIGLSFALLQAVPALGILAARASLSVQRSLDSGVLLEVVEEARDRLGLPPGDPAREVYEQMLDRETVRRVDELVKQGESVERERLAVEAEGLREKLLESKARIADLERGLRAQEASLTRLPPAPASAQPAVLPAAAPTPPPAYEEERRRLRTKVAELQQLLTERNEERIKLRRQLAQVHDALATEAETVEHAPDAKGADLDDGAPVEAPRVLLIPIFSAPCKDALCELPSAVARKALASVAALAGGDAAAWRQVKRMVAASTPLLSCRIGIHHRALLRVEEGELTVLTVIHRKDLEAAIKRYGRSGSG